MDSKLARSRHASSNLYTEGFRAASVERFLQRRLVEAPGDFRDANNERERGGGRKLPILSGGKAMSEIAAADANEMAAELNALASRFVRAYPPETAPAGPAFYLPFQKGEIVTRTDGRLSDEPILLPADSAGDANILFFGRLDGVPCVTYRVPQDAVVPNGFEHVGLRTLYGRVEEEEYAIAGYASELLDWRENYRFCSRCGTTALPQDGTWGMVCPNCGYTVYPPVSPAVLALVHDGADRVLLAKKPGWGRRYSILAGFVEPGESLEGCVVREVFEEAGVHVRDLVYTGSQAWPFPHQVMVGFTARHAGGEITIQADELEDAAWFSFDALPELPSPLSLSRQIIDAWVASRQK